MLGTDDGIIPADTTRAVYERMAPPKRLVELGDAGHLAFSDICLIGRDEGGLTGLVEQAGLDLPADLLRLASDGCEPGALDPEAGFAPIDHLSVAFLRSAFFGIGEGLFGCFYDLPALACAMGTAGHRQPADLIASTYVIDAVYLGRLIMRHDKRVSAGPESVTADEMATFVKQQTGVAPPPGKKITEPFYDKGRDTYVVFNTKRDEWLQFDKAANEWISLR